MGWFSNDDAPKAKKSDDGGYIAPDRGSRALCWEARDGFFRCLDRHNIIDSVKEDKAARDQCPVELKGFERNCAASWVKYFKQKRVVDIKKERTLQQLAAEGATNLPTLTSSSGLGRL